MRRKIIVFANGWGNECLIEIGDGLKSVAEKNDIDIFNFVNYAAYADIDTNNLGEFNIFTVPDVKDFDGAVVLGNSFNSQREMDYVREQIREAGIPAVSVEAKIEGMDFFGIDDYLGMSEVVEHLISEHGVKDILYIGGIEGHEGDTIRRKAVVETALKHGIKIPEDNIIRGDFAAQRAIDALTCWRRSHTMPEAIICANDIMAIGICNYLKEERINVPEDILVTGFDCLKAAGNYEPSITSVNREWLSMGKGIMEKLLEKMDGKQVEQEKIMPSKMVRGESCGCHLNDSDTNTWKTLREKNMDRDLNSFRVDQHFRHMFLALRNVDTLDHINYSLSEYYNKEGWLEGNDVMLALCPNFFVYTEEGPNKQMEYGYPEHMDAACLRCDGKNYESRRAKTSKIIFEVANRKANPGVYIFAPIRSEKEMFGFIMVSRGYSIVQNDILYIMTKHVGQYLEQVKSNVAIEHLTKQLEALSITDALTGVYNRAGCETVIYSKLKECQGKGGQSVIMFADVDKLKKINDMYGHGAGDVAITTSINLLQQFLPKDYMIGRFGGDEFLIAAPCLEKIDVDSYAEELMDRISKAPITKEFSYKISLSIGGVQLNPGQPFNIQDCLHEMDEKVYKLKELHHKESYKG